MTDVAGHDIIIQLERHVAMPVVPAGTPCVKGGASLLGSISSIEGKVVPAAGGGNEKCAAAATWHTGTQTHGLRSPRPDLCTSTSAEAF